MAARFDAFISYSRSASSRLAVELRGGIERFAKPWYRLRSSRVFLDDASMSANTGLWSNIEKGLTEADWFVLLCSPRSAASQYVTNEISWWLEHKSADRILMVLDEGEIFWKADDFDWDRATAVNPALSKAFAEEPRWVDLSWFDQEGSLGTADPRFPERVADLAAAIRGVERDELIGANVRERRRALRLLRGGVIALSALLVASLVATVLAVVNGNAAAEQARIALARQLAAQAITLAQTDLQAASLLAVEAQRLHDDPQTQAALFQLASASPQLVRTLPVGATVQETAVSADGSVFTGDAEGAVIRWSGGDRIDLADLNAPVVGLSVSADGGYVAATTGDDTVRVMTPTGDIEVTVLPPDGSDSATLAVLSPDATFLAVTDRVNWLTLLRLEATDDEEIYTPIGTVPHGGRVGFGEGELTTFASWGGWSRISLADASVIDSGAHTLGAAANGFAVSRDGSALAGSLEKSVNYSIWNTVGSISDGGDAPGDPADRVATSTVAGSLDLALDDTGDRLAVMVDGAIYVSTVRSLQELPEPPIALLGAGKVNVESLTFAGDVLVNGSGEYALVWDLGRSGRILDEYEAQVPSGCTQCGPPLVAVNGRGDRAVSWAIAGGPPIVADLTDGIWYDIDPDAQFGLAAASWWDDDTFIVASRTENALLVADADQLEVELAIPLNLGDGVAALALRAHAGDGRVDVLADDGAIVSVDEEGTELARFDAFGDLLDIQPPRSYGIAPDGSTAYLFITGDGETDGLRMVDLRTGDVLLEVTNPVAATYDGRSRLHVFADGRDVVYDAEGAVVLDRPGAVEDVPLPAMSSDGRLATTGGRYGVMSILDLDRGGAAFGRITVPVQDNRYPATAFSPDGSALITVTPEMESLDRPATISRLTLDPADWRASACAVAGRDLTPEEWRTFVGTEPPADLRCER